MVRTMLNEIDPVVSCKIPTVNQGAIQFDKGKAIICYEKVTEVQKEKYSHTKDYIKDMRSKITTAFILPDGLSNYLSDIYNALDNNVESIESDSSKVLTEINNYVSALNKNMVITNEDLQRK